MRRLEFKDIQGGFCKLISSRKGMECVEMMNSVQASDESRRDCPFFSVCAHAEGSARSKCWYGIKDLPDRLLHN
jgi:hypothetical protein